MHKSATKEDEGQGLIRMRDTYNGACGAATQENKEERRNQKQTQNLILVGGQDLKPRLIFLTESSIVHPSYLFDPFCSLPAYISSISVRMINLATCIIYTYWSISLDFCCIIKYIFD